MCASYQRRELLELQVNINNNNNKSDSQVVVEKKEKERCKEECVLWEHKWPPRCVCVCVCLPSEICLLGVASQRSRGDKASANAAVQMLASFDANIIQSKSS